MTPTFALAFVATWLAFGIALGYVIQRTRRMRRALQEAIHDRGLALDLRCDALQHRLDAQQSELVTLRTRLDTLTLIARIDHLLGLVESAERRALLAPELAATLTGYGLDLRAEARGRERF